MSAGTLTSSPDLSGDLPSVLLDSFQDGSGSLCSTSFQQQAMLGGAAPSSAASIYIKGMPETADKLWLYEKFARWACRAVGSWHLWELGAAALSSRTQSSVCVHVLTHEGRRHTWLLDSTSDICLQVWRHCQRACADRRAEWQV